jgi:nitroimidazol reductase NimA-like FMN-containing flavoprotein (pyridoxamine 5'-phosphate oxidase superfamily)|uniref:Pyridoxamine 5'-phosphate oxidase putative domain-containing protein n=1 Tax=Ignavibacterium album TaxID=591197 RepID=A0A832G205_9BACT
MQRNQTIIRDIQAIEKDINEAFSGVASMLLDSDKIYQVPTNFVYLDKNIFVYLDKNEEVFESIKFNSPASFSIIKTEKQGGKEITYRSKSVTINGEIRIVDEPKVIEQIKENYRKKYSPRISFDDYQIPENLILCIIDTLEIKAVIEEGN